MAITKIHPVTNTLNLAIDYITNPHKTEEQKFVDCFDCTHIFAAYEFLSKQEEKGYRGRTQAFHMIQSFEPGEVTPEQANEIGKKLADELLKGQYEYVISTHIDKEHIHNHIIINAVNSETGSSDVPVSAADEQLPEPPDGYEEYADGIREALDGEDDYPFET